MDPGKLLGEWRTGLRIAHKANQQAASRFELYGRWLSVATVIASTVVGTSLFTAASEAGPWKIATGVLSLVAALLSAVQGTLKFSELAAVFRATAQHYGRLRREVEESLAEIGAGETVTKETLASIRKRWDEVDEDAPSVPQKLYDRIARQITNALPLHPQAPET